MQKPHHERRPMQRDVWVRARKAAAKVEKKYGVEISGKLSALRWVLGDEWDMLDT